MHTIRRVVVDQPYRGARVHLLTDPDQPFGTVHSVEPHSHALRGPDPEQDLHLLLFTDHRNELWFSTHAGSHHPTDWSARPVSGLTLPLEARGRNFTLPEAAFSLLQCHDRERAQLVGLSAEVVEALATTMERTAPLTHPEEVVLLLNPVREYLQIGCGAGWAGVQPVASYFQVLELLYTDALNALHQALQEDPFAEYARALTGVAA